MIDSWEGGGLGYSPGPEILLGGAGGAYIRGGVRAAAASVVDDVVTELSGLPLNPLTLARTIKARFAKPKKVDAPDVDAPDDFIIPGKKWYHGTDVDSADDIARNGLDRRKLLGSDPVEGADTPGFFVTDKLSHAEDYARIRGAERGRPGAILEADDADIGRFLEGVGTKTDEAVIPFDAFDKLPPGTFGNGGS